MEISRRKFLGLVLGAAVSWGACPALAAPRKIITTRTGKFMGNGGKVQSWLGIPYAKPPVGALRWRPAEKLEPSNKEYSAKKFGASPVQDRDKVEPASLYEQSEDCLTLNIWTRGTEGRKPVMVFIPGGGFVSGGSVDPLYNGTRLAMSGAVVVVTINYRLNIFGFMNFRNVDANYKSSGYLGLTDQVAALQWVHENIEAFGGDPDNVTIFGESAGAGSVMLQMVNPAAKGLFHKAIAQSGHLAFHHKPEQSSKLTDDFMQMGGYRNMSDLLNASTQELEKTYEQLMTVRLFATETDYFPTCDGEYLPAQPAKALRDGAGRGIKLLTGTTEEEYRYWQLYYPSWMKEMREFHDTINPLLYDEEFGQAVSVYDKWQLKHMDLPEPERYFEFANQLDWRVGQELSAEYQSAFNDVYFYLFSQKASANDLGSCHAVDLPYVFNNPSPDIEPKPVAKMVKQVQQTWINFATTGNPNNGLIPHWEPYTVDNRQTMEINSKGWACHKDLNNDNLSELRHLYEN